MPYAEKLRRVRADINAAVELENRLGGKPQLLKSSAEPTPLPELLNRSVDACRAERKRKRDADGHGGDGRGRVSDDELVALARHAQNYALAPYRKFLHYVPRLVNVVSLAEAVPAEGSGVTLPLDVRLIASRCRGAFYAPSRFAAVQLAFSQPRSRILIFHTGHFVGAGTTGSIAARTAIVRAQRQLALEAGIHLKIQSFQIKNTVGAVSLRASLNCDAFASAHSADAHFDPDSFVGLAWRPPRESLCCGALAFALTSADTELSVCAFAEIYSTGKGNLPGSVAQRQLLDSFSRMLPGAALRAKTPSSSSDARPLSAPPQSSSASPPRTPSSPRSPRSCSAPTAKTRPPPRRSPSSLSTPPSTAPSRAPTRSAAPPPPSRSPPRPASPSTSGPPTTTTTPARPFSTSATATVSPPSASNRDYPHPLSQSEPPHGARPRPLGHRRRPRARRPRRRRRLCPPVCKTRRHLIV